MDMQIHLPTTLYYLRRRGLRGSNEHQVGATMFRQEGDTGPYVLLSPAMAGTPSFSMYRDCDCVLEEVPEEVCSPCITGMPVEDSYTIINGLTCLYTQGVFLVDIVATHARLKLRCGLNHANEAFKGFGVLERWIIARMAEEQYRDFMDALLIDTVNDPNSIDTPRRVAKMMVNELFVGRYSDAPKNTAFDNVKQFGGNYIVGPIALKSMCAHHHIPIIGDVYIAVFLKDTDKLSGLSKLSRITQWLMRRPQNQEELTQQLAYQVQQVTGASGVAVVIKGTHMCMTHRGVNEPRSAHLTSFVSGEYRKHPELKQEVFNLFNIGV